MIIRIKECKHCDHDDYYGMISRTSEKLNKVIMGHITDHRGNICSKAVEDALVLVFISHFAAILSESSNKEEVSEYVLDTVSYIAKKSFDALQLPIKQ